MKVKDKLTHLTNTIYDVFLDRGVSDVVKVITPTTIVWSKEFVRRVLYNTIEWDKIMHTFAGSLSYYFSEKILERLTDVDNGYKKLLPFAISMVANLLWEAFEYGLSKVTPYQWVGKGDTFYDILYWTLGIVGYVIMEKAYDTLLRRRNQIQ